MMGPMDEPTMDTAAKLRVRDALVARARAALAGFQGPDGSVAEEHAAAERSGSGATTVDDLSQADEAGDLHGLFEGSEAHAESALKHLESLDFSVTEVVRPGAIIAFEGERFVVGVLATEFDCDGTTYEGITSDAPIYDAIAGLRAGDTFEFAGRTHTLDLVV